MNGCVGDGILGLDWFFWWFYLECYQKFSVDSPPGECVHCVAVKTVPTVCTDRGRAGTAVSVTEIRFRLVFSVVLRQKWSEISVARN